MFKKILTRPYRTLFHSRPPFGSIRWQHHTDTVTKANLCNSENTFVITKTVIKIYIFHKIIRSNNTHLNRGSSDRVVTQVAPPNECPIMDALEISSVFCRNVNHNMLHTYMGNSRIMKVKLYPSIHQSNC